MRRLNTRHGSWPHAWTVAECGNGSCADRVGSGSAASFTAVRCGAGSVGNSLTAGGTITIKGSCSSPLASRRANQLADRLLGHAQPVSDRHVAQPLPLEFLDQTQSPAGNTAATAPPPLRPAQSCHPALGVTLLVPPHRALGPAKGTGDLRLLRKTTVDQHRHRIRSPSHTPWLPHRQRHSDTRAALRPRPRVDLPRRASNSAHR